jgi:N-acetylglucosaminyldiphosphoundecaprenol N-acetyl-beta-D-mannosaminyltransferase
VIDGGKRNVLGVLVDAVDDEAAVRRIIEAARESKPLAVSALAVHGVMSAVGDSALRYRLNKFDLVAPDGQPVRWALNVLHQTRLRRQVRGVDLTDALLARAAGEGLPVFFYGNTQDVLDRLVVRLRARHPGLDVAGTRPSTFRPVDPHEARAIGERIRASGARLVFVGLGCPRQERFVSALRDGVGVPLVAVGAAFDYLAETLSQPPVWVQRAALEWLWRLAQEPRRLWRRYLLLNPAFLTLLALQRVGVWKPQLDLPPTLARPPHAYDA